MDKNEILNDIKKNYTFKADNNIFEGVLSGIEGYEQEERPARTFAKLRILRPATVFYVVIFLIVSAFAVTAAVNEDLRDYFILLFGGNPNPVNGEMIGATAESDGVELTVDAVVADGDSIFMIYTLRDEGKKVFNETTAIDSYKFVLGGNVNYNANYNTIIKNGGKNYMILYGNSIKKGIQKINFSLESLKVPDPSKVFTIPAGTADYHPEGIPGYTIESVILDNNRIRASIRISSQDEYVHNYDIRVRNKKTGEVFDQNGETMETNSDNKLKTLGWYSEKLDYGKTEDYELLISFDKVRKFEKPLSVEFYADLSKNPVKTIYPVDAYVLTAAVEKVTVHQMSIIADLRDTIEPKTENEKPVQATEADDAFLEENRSPGIIGQRMTVRYEDGTEADVINASSSGSAQGEYRFYLLLNGSLDYSRKPSLFIGETKIPLG